MILYKCSSFSRPSELHGYQVDSENRTTKRILRVLGPEQEMSMHIQARRILRLKAREGWSHSIIRVTVKQL